MTESKYIEALKTHWRNAMKDLVDAQKRVNYYAGLIQEARQKEMMESLELGELGH